MAGLIIPIGINATAFQKGLVKIQGAGKAAATNFQKGFKSVALKPPTIPPSAGIAAGKKFGAGFKNAFKNQTAGLGDTFKAALAGFGAASLITSGISKITQGFSSAITLAKDFEVTLADVKAITGVTDETLNKFGDSARKLAITFGTDATDQLNTFKGILSKLGPAIAENPVALEAMTVSINTLAKAGGIDAQTAMSTLANTMLQFSIPLDDQAFAAEEMARVMNVLAAGAKEGASEIPQSGEAMLKFGAAAKASNISIEESGAIIQTLSKAAGLFGAEAGVGVRNVLVSMQKESGPVTAIFKKMGLNFKDVSNTLTKKGLNAAMMELKKGMETLPSDAAKNAAAIQIFGKANLSTGLALLNNTKMTADFTRKMTGTTVAVDQAAIVMSTFAEQMSSVMATIEDVGITIGQTLIPAFQFVIANAKTIGTVLAIAGGALLAFLAPVAAVTAAIAALVLAGGLLVASYIDTTDELIQSNSAAMESINIQKTQLTEKKKLIENNTAWIASLKEEAKDLNTTAEKEQFVKDNIVALREEYPETIKVTDSFQTIMGKMNGILEDSKGKLNGVTTALGKLDKQMLALQKKEIELRAKRAGEVFQDAFVDEMTGTADAIENFFAEALSAGQLTGNAKALAQGFAKRLVDGFKDAKTVAEIEGVFVDLYGGEFIEKAEKEGLDFESVKGKILTLKQAYIDLLESKEVTFGKDENIDKLGEAYAATSAKIAGLDFNLKATNEGLVSIGSEMIGLLDVTKLTDAGYEKLNGELKLHVKALGDIPPPADKAKRSYSDIIKEMAKMVVAGTSASQKYRDLTAEAIKLKTANDNAKIALMGVKLQLDELSKAANFSSEIRASFDAFKQEVPMPDLHQLGFDFNDSVATNINAVSEIVKGLSSSFIDGAGSANIFESAYSSIFDTGQKSIFDTQEIALLNFKNSQEQFFLWLDEQRKKNLELEQAAQDERTRMAKVYTDAVVGFGDIIFSNEKTNLGERLKALGKFLLETIKQHLIAGQAKALIDALSVSVIDWTAVLRAGALIIAMQAVAAGVGSLLGAKEGSKSLTRSGITPGGVNEVAGVFHGQEYIFNAKQTKKHFPLFSYLDNGGTEKSYFEKFYKPNDDNTAKAKSRRGGNINASFNHSFNDATLKGNDIAVSVSRSQSHTIKGY